MGFAEDKFHQYLKENMQSLTDITLTEILMYLPCLTTQNQEKLRQRVLLNGNEATLWEFITDLKKRDNWANQFLSALRKCRQYRLADDLQSVYDSYSPVKRASEPRNPPPRMPQAASLDHSPYNSPQQPQVVPPYQSNTQPQASTSNTPKALYSDVVQAVAPVHAQANSSLAIPENSPEVQQDSEALQSVQESGQTQLHPYLEHHPVPTRSHSDFDTQSWSSPNPINHEMQSRRSNEARVPVTETSSESSYYQENSNFHNTHQDQESTEPAVTSFTNAEDNSANVLSNPSSTSLASQITHPRPDEIRTLPGPSIHPTHLPAAIQPSGLTTYTERLKAMTQPPFSTGLESSHNQPPLASNTDQYHVPVNTEPSSSSITHTEHLPVGVQPSTAQVTHIERLPVGVQPSTARVTHTERLPVGVQPSNARVTHTERLPVGVQPSTAQVTHTERLPVGVQPSTAQVTHTERLPVGIQPSTAQVTHTENTQPNIQLVSFLNNSPEHNTTKSSNSVAGNVPDSAQPSNTCFTSTDNIATIAPTLPAPETATNHSTASTARDGDVQQATPATYLGGGRSTVHPVPGNRNDEYYISKPGVLQSNFENIRIGEDANASDVTISNDPLQISVSIHSRTNQTRRIGDDVTGGAVNMESDPLMFSSGGQSRNNSQNGRTISDPLMISSSSSMISSAGPPNLRDTFSPMNHQPRTPQRGATGDVNGNTPMQYPKDPEENEYTFKSSPGESFRYSGRHKVELSPPEDAPTNIPEEYSFDTDTETARFSLNYNEEASVDLTAGNADRMHQRPSVKKHDGKNGNESEKQMENQDRERTSQTDNSYTSNILLVSLIVAAISVSVIMLWRKN
uniref:Mitochondrial antiviral-signaling protein n=1 Tax=Leptobrachium leishanense TaxID=445787 RepID=A0A8C5PDW7_9ANUR